jgi:uncharacterized protein (TIGR02147 family)
MSSITVYQYQSARDYLKDMIADQKRVDPEFSIRRFCRQSALGSHALLIMLLNGKRKMTLKQVPAFAQAFKMSSLERMYFQTLIQLDNARSEEEQDLCKLWLNDLNPKPEMKMVEVEQFHVISNWIHMAILTLAKIEGAKITAENVYTLVNEKVSLSECRQAIERLLDLRLLEEKDGSLKPTHSWIRTKDDVSNRGAREYHKQVLKLATDAIEEQGPDIREFQSFALTLPHGKISLAKDLIRKFRNQLVLALESEPGHEVYQCNLQFFRLTESPLAPVLSTASAVNEGAAPTKTTALDSTQSQEV